MQYALENSELKHKEINEVNMAKYDVKFSCGHEETIVLFGKETERKRKIEWFERNGICSKCYKECLDEEANYIKEECNAYGLTITIGTEKQIKVAYKIALKYFKNYDNAVIRMGDAIAKCQGQNPEKAQKMQKSLDEGILAGQLALLKINAKFWLDNQYNNVFDVLNKEFQQNNGNIPTLPPKPDIITGAWNGRIYGKEGKYHIYIDNTDVFITDEQEKEIIKYSKFGEDKSQKNI